MQSGGSVRHSENQVAIVFDLDDTLVATSEVYARSKSAFVRVLGEEGFSDSEVERVFEAQDAENIERHGYGPGRYAQSMVETYSVLCRRTGTAQEKRISSTISQIGETISTADYRVHPGVKEMLELLSQTYKLILFTRGDPGLQRLKVDKGGLNSFFESIHVVERKDVATLGSLLAEARVAPECSWMVGDSVKSDINPALRLGLRCIWVQWPSNGYIWLQEVADPISEKYFVARDSATVLEIILGSRK